MGSAGAGTRDGKNHDSQRCDRILRFFSARKSGNLLHILGPFPSEGVSTGVWCVPGFGAGFEFALEPSKLQKEGENPGKGHF